MNKGIKFLSCLFFLLLISSKNLAAINFTILNPPSDSTEKAIKKLSNKEAHKAAIMSAILPGLGQAYNKKFWKIPIVYAALAGGIVLFSFENHKYQLYHKELQYRYAHNHPDSSNTEIPSNLILDASQLNIQKIVYDKYRDFSAVAIIVVYALNVIDASIDGHFKTFDVSDNLSLSIKPKTFYSAQKPFGIGGAGLSLSLTFK
ncbi:MAG TPA: DUF5683 domain-containing protein [Bacteroidia bacterium]|jgi:hypothetical protein|nr:DUF5683 domain-containing protein [Bacteroidia bacterium]